MAIASDTEEGTILLAGDLAGGGDATAPQLSPTGVTPGEYKGASIIVDSKGRIVHARSVLPQDVPCATADNCGIVKVTNLHNIEYQNQTISIPQASKTKHGVVKLGEGFGQECCEIFVDFIKATDVREGTVFVPEDGHLVVDGVGQLSVPAASATEFGVLQPSILSDVSNIGGTLSYVPPTGAVDQLGFVSVGFGITVADGVISVPPASTTEVGSLAFSPDFNIVDGVGNYNTIATEFDVGFVKLGDGLSVDETGALSRGQGVGSETSKGIIQITDSDGLSISGGVVSFSSPSATKVKKGTVQVGTGLEILGDVVSPKVSNGSDLGVIGTTSPLLSIVDGVIDISADFLSLDENHTYTKTQAYSIKDIPCTPLINLNLFDSNIFNLVLTSDVNIAIPTNMVDGGKYILIVTQDDVGGRTVSWDASWKFIDSHGDRIIGSSVGISANAINVIHFTVINNTIITQIQRNFS